MLLAQKYAPKKTEDVLGNISATRQLKRWMLMWMKGQRQRPLIITGPPGIGKTAMVYALRDELDLELVIISASDFRDRASIEKILGGSILAGTLSGKQKVILIDDVDAMDSEDRGGIPAIAKLIGDAPSPVILTAGDLWERKIAPLRALCTPVELRRPIAPSIAKLLEHIAKNESIQISAEKINSISENAHGDIRAAINDLQANSPGMRDREKDVFTRLRNIFNAQTYSEAKNASFGDIDHDLLKLWIDENIPLAYPPADVPAAYDALSRADVFDGRIMNRQAWGFLRYSNDLMTAGVALARTEMRPRFVRYQFPSYLKRMKETSSTRAQMKSILTKIGRKMHTSPKQAESFLPIFAHFYSENPGYFESNYGIEEKEGELLSSFAPALGKKKKAAAPKKEKPAEEKKEKKEDVKQVEKEEKETKEKKEREEKEKAEKAKKEKEHEEKKRAEGEERKKEEEKAKEREKEAKEHKGPRLHEFF